MIMMVTLRPNVPDHDTGVARFPTSTHIHEKNGTLPAVTSRPVVKLDSVPLTRALRRCFLSHPSTSFLVVSNHRERVHAGDLHGGVPLGKQPTGIPLKARYCSGHGRHHPSDARTGSAGGNACPQ
ncbi:hypothetical protein EZV78_06200 [Cutibacterium avidum]|nr:hypothetical protein EZV78_06200 [Cutibacterium avidum]